MSKVGGFERTYFFNDDPILTTFPYLVFRPSETVKIKEIFNRYFAEQNSKVSWLFTGNPLSFNAPTSKWSNTLKRLVGKLLELVLKGLILFQLVFIPTFRNCLVCWKQWLLVKDVINFHKITLPRLLTIT